MMDSIGQAVGTVLGVAFLLTIGGMFVYAIARAIPKRQYYHRGSPITEREANSLRRGARDEINRVASEEHGIDDFLIEPDPEELIHHFRDDGLPLCRSYVPDGLYSPSYECPKCDTEIKTYYEEVDEYILQAELEANQGFHGPRPTLEESAAAQIKGIPSDTYAVRFRGQWLARQRALRGSGEKGPEAS